MIKLKLTSATDPILQCIAYMVMDLG
jgi:hypothetical protein